MLTTWGLVAIVEGDESMRASIACLLQASHYETAAFASAEEFLESTSVGSAIGLVLDIPSWGYVANRAMPAALCRHLLTDRSSLPVVFITARDDGRTRSEAMALGCVDFLIKRFSADQLTSALERGRTR